ncbi:MAG: DegV family protein [Clostridiales bacterium]|nr:DegV family protein [Clostridiales bacterium]
MAIKLIIDSASDIPVSYAKEHGMTYLPLPVTIGEKQYLSGVDITPQAFYEILIESDCLPVTSQVSPFAFEQAFRTAIEQGDTPVAITLSSKLSGTYQSACIAAANFGGQAFVVDSMNVSLGQAILVYYAERLIAQGISAPALVSELDRAKQKIKVVALLDTLEYLKKGGRISAATAVVGGILSIKPVVSVVNGEVQLIGKARGSKQGNNLLNEMVANSHGVDFSMPLTLAFSGLSDALLQKYIADSHQLWEGRVSNLPVLTIGATIGTHAGPGAIGVAFFEQ